MTLGRASAALLLGLIFPAAVATLWRGNPTQVEGPEPGRAGVAIFELAPEPPAAAADRAAILVHGYQCNHSMMTPLGRALAASGHRVFMLDLPGHGASPARYSDAAATRAAAEAVELVLRRTRLPRERVALVGHSYGAMVLTPVLADHPQHPSVFIGPGYRPGVSTAHRRALTILTAERDYPFVVEAARRFAADATGGALHGPGTWSGEDGRAEWRVIPETGHVGLIYRPDAHAAVVNALGGAAAAPRRSSSAATVATAGAMLLASLAASLLVAGGCRRAPPVSEGAPRTTWLRLALVGGYAALISVAIVRLRSPLSFLDLQEGDILASYILCAGMLAAVAGRLAFGAWPLPAARAALAAFPPAFAAVALVYLAGAVAISRTAYYVTFDALGWRLLAACVLAVAFYPFFAVGEQFAASVRMRSMRLGAVKPWACRLALPLAAAAALPLLSYRLERFAPAVLALGLFCSIFGALLSRVSRNPAVGSIFASSVCAWIVAVGFILH